MPSKDQFAAADLTPLSPAVFHILLSLGEGERHGYALKREISLRTGGKLKLGPGVLYGSIHKMLELGLIEESEDRPDPHLDDERRRYYRITPHGRKVAQAEAARMRELVRLAAARFGGNPSVSGMGLKISLDIWRQVRYSTLGVRIRADERASPAATELCRS